MMRHIRIDPKEFPIKPSEGWWVVHPNTPNCEFRVPSGAVTVCKEDFCAVFKKNTVYDVVAQDKYNGWVTVAGGGHLYAMPEYVFARYFDAEAFVVGIGPVDPDQARPFDYQPTLPRKPKQMEIEEFKDG
jgi:hypothetical protein